MIERRRTRVWVDQLSACMSLSAVRLNGKFIFPQSSILHALLMILKKEKKLTFFLEAVTMCNKIQSVI